jgi:hypothetical protein
MANAIYRGFNLHGPEFAAQLKDMAEGGALRMRGYKGYRGQPPRGLELLAEKTPGIRHLKDAVFGDPGMSKGLGGQETRLRAVLWNLAKADNPKLTNVQLGRLVNDAMGTYVEPLTPGMVRLLQPVDPFIRAGTAMLKTGARALQGKDALGRRSLNNVVATYGTLVAAAYYSKMLDDKGEWPWQKPGWKLNRLMFFDRGGKRHGVSFSDIQNPLSRASNYSGATALVNSWREGNRGADNLFFDWKKGVLNAWMGRFGPWMRTLGRAGMGREAYVLPDGTLMPSHHPSMSGAEKSPTGEWAKTTLYGLIPLLGKTFGEEGLVSEGLMGHQGGKEMLPDDALARFLVKLNDYFSAPYVPKQYPQTSFERPLAQYRTQQQFDDTVQDIVRRAKNVSPDALQAFIQEEIEGRLTNDVVMVFGRPTPARLAALQQVYQRLGRAPGSAAKGMAIQELNQQMAP